MQVLPLDVVYSVLDQIDDKKSIASCSLVCRKWSQHSQRLLFANYALCYLFFHHYDEFDPPDAPTTDDWRSFGDVYRAMPPRIASYVKHLIFEPSESMPFEVLLPVPLSTIYTIVQCLPRLQTVTLCHLVLGNVPDGGLPKLQGRELSQLVLQRVTVYSTVVDLLNIFSQVRELKLSLTEDHPLALQQSLTELNADNESQLRTTTPVHVLTFADAWDVSRVLTFLLHSVNCKTLHYCSFKFVYWAAHNYVHDVASFLEKSDLPLLGLTFDVSELTLRPSSTVWTGIEKVFALYCNKGCTLCLKVALHYKGDDKSMSISAIPSLPSKTSHLTLVVKVSPTLTPLNPWDTREPWQALRRFLEPGTFNNLRELSLILKVYTYTSVSDEAVTALKTLVQEEFREFDRRDILRIEGYAEWVEDFTPRRRPIRSHRH